MTTSDDTVGHTPVLYQPVLSALDLEAGRRYIDATVGAGGHSAGILEGSSPNGRLLGLDRDPSALKLAKKNLAPYVDRLYLHHASFTALKSVVATEGWETVDGILFDLGLSSMQIFEPERGFSFRLEGPLDMRFDPSQETTAEDLINNLRHEDLTEIIRTYGEERRARRVARAIVEARPIQDTLHLARIVQEAVGPTRQRIHPATRTFQALRIAVNDELEALKDGLAQSLEVLREGGRLVVIAYHSLEDRIVKRYFREQSRDCVCPPEELFCRCEAEARLRVLTKRPIRPDEAEIEANPRSRSARLRIAERISPA